MGKGECKVKVKKFMSTEIDWLSPENTIWDASSLFLEKKIDGAPVLEDGKLIGLITKTHLFRCLQNRDDPYLCKIRDYMSTHVVTTSPESDIRSVDIMHNGRYPVIENNDVIGFLSKSDIMKALYQILDEVSGQLETVINSVYNPIVAINKAGLIVTWNKAAEKMTKLNYKDVIGHYISNIIPESELIKIIKTGESEFGIKLKIGDVSTITNRAPIIKNGEIFGAVAVLYDQSEIEKISKELVYVKSLNTEMDAIINSSFDGLYITDGKGMTLRVNKAVERITGLKEHEFLNKSMHELVDSGILSNSATILVLKDKKPVTTSLTTITGIQVLVSATPVFDETGQIFRVVTNVRDVSELTRLKQKVEHLEVLKNHFESQVNQMKLKLSDNLIYKNHKMDKLVIQAIKIAEVDSTILVSGESGVGKELIAELIHNNSYRKNSPFVKLNCAAIPENLLESELFGYESGAFTGAKKEGKPGLFEVATGGTFLLDEIGDIPMHLQVKLLRALQEREIIRIGGSKPIQIDARIIAMTNKNLENMVNNGQFREDLYYRLNVIPVHVPPLRERIDDIPLLIHYFLDKFNQRYKLNKTIELKAIDILTKYEWPGNIRQLENLVERMVVTTSSKSIKADHLPSYLLRPSENSSNNYEAAVIVNNIMPLKVAVESVEQILIRKTFTIADSCHKVAEILDVNPSTISRKARKYGIKIRA